MTQVVCPNHIEGWGLVKYNMKQWAEAISDFNKSMDYKTAPLDDRLTSVMDYLLGLAYYNLGNMKLQKHSYFLLGKPLSL